MTAAPPARDRAADHRDDATRHLCAAAHLNPFFADAAVAEMLVEPTRATPPHSGVAPAPVMTEAISARNRFRVVTILTAALLHLVATFFPAVVALGIGAALVLALVRLLRRIFRWNWTFAPMTFPRAAAYGAVLVIVYPALSAVEDLSGGTASLEDPLLGALALLSVLVLLLANRAVVRHLIVTHFQKRPGSPTPPVRSQDLFVGMSAKHAAAVRERYIEAGPTVALADTAPGEIVPVITYRSFNPFVGSGVDYKPWSIAIPLEPIEDEADPDALSTAALTEAVKAEFDRLTRAGGLAPSGRFARMRCEEVVAVSAEELVCHLDQQDSTLFLKSPAHRPYSHVTREHALQLRDNPVEWARYFRSYTIETWDRDLVVTLYVHVAVNESSLYIEWTPMLLLPIHQEFREIDNRRYGPGWVLARALGDFFRLPSRLVPSLTRLFTLLRPIKVERGMISWDRYGSLISLREMVADPENVRNYFQRVDVDRYVKLTAAHVMKGVGKVLESAGYEQATLERHVRALAQTSIHIEGDVNGTFIHASKDISLG